MTLLRKMKKQATDWEMILVNYISDQELIARIYKNSQNLIRKQTIQLKGKWRNKQTLH